MNRKGFSIAYMAMVLIVMGFVFSMVTKSTILADRAKINTDIAKIKKIEAAASTYYTKVRELPPSPIPKLLCYVDSKKSFAGELIDSDYISKAYPGLRFGLVKGEILNSGVIKKECTPNKHYSDLILTAAIDNILTNSNLMPKSLACNIELFIDDKKILSGKGRAITTSTAAEWQADDFLECKAMKGNYSYGYIVF